VPGFFRARKIQRSKQEQHTSQNQNEKICQQSTFLTFIIYSSLSLSLAFVLFLGSIRSFFASFWCVVSLPLFGQLGRQGILFPQKKPIRQCFPLHTRFKSETSYRENAYFSLSHLRGALFILFSFLAEDIYTLTFFFFSRCLGDPRERVRVRKSSHRGDDPFF
jgi:hypothetical protein